MEVLKMPWRPDPDPWAPGRREFLLHEELEQRLEQAIIAAEEARAEEERGACAEILELEAQRYEAGFAGPLERKIAELLLTLATKIRARSEGGKK